MTAGRLSIGGVDYDVTLTPVTSPPTPVPTPTPVARRANVVYYMMWRTSGSPTLDRIPASVTELRLAFLQGAPSLVGFGPYTDATAFRAALAPLRERGVRITGAVGGQAGAVNTAARDAFLAGVDNVHKQVPLEGLDWDVEAAALRADDTLALSQAVRDRYGWQVSMAPNGTNVDTYLPVGVELHRRGLLSTFGQQFYDAVVSYDAALGRIRAAVAAGIPADRYTVGMMLPRTGEDPATFAKRWTAQQCVDNMTALRTLYPGIGSYLWEAGRPATLDTATRIGALA